MSRYLLDKFLFTVDRDPELVERYRDDGRHGHGGRRTWPALLGCPPLEASTWQELTAEEREALTSHDYAALFRLGAHPFLTLTLFIAMFERDYDEPLGFQRLRGQTRPLLAAALPGHRDMIRAARLVARPATRSWSRQARRRALDRRSRRRRHSRTDHAT